MKTSSTREFAYCANGMSETAIETKIQSVSASEGFMLTPIIIIGIGRGGTTMLMSMLGRDPRVLFDRTYAFETRLLSHVAKFCQTLPVVPLFRAECSFNVATGEIANQQPVSLGTGNRKTDTKIDMQQLLISMWRSVSKSSLENNETALFYAEKASAWLAQFLQGKLETFSIFLFRDPKDVFLSQTSFSEKMGANLFGQSEDTKKALMIAYKLCLNLETFLALSPSKNVLCLKYEEVVSNQEEAAAALSKFCGWVPAEPEDQSVHENHKTTRNSEASVGRWQSEQIPQAALTYLDCVPTEVLNYCNYSTAKVADDKISKTIAFNDGEFAKQCSGTEVRLTGEGQCAKLEALSEHGGLTVKATADLPRQIGEIWLAMRECNVEFLTLQWREDGQEYSTEREVKSNRLAQGLTNIAIFSMAEQKNLPENWLEFRIVGWFGPEEKQLSHRLRWIKFIARSNTDDNKHPVESIVSDKTESSRQGVNRWLGKLIGRK